MHTTKIIANIANYVPYSRFFRGGKISQIPQINSHSLKFYPRNISYVQNRVVIISNVFIVIVANGHV